MDLMEMVKREREENSHDCANCRLNFDGTRCMIVHHAPYKWDIEAIRKALCKSSDKGKIVVPNMW